VGREKEEVERVINEAGTGKCLIFRMKKTVDINLHYVVF
jgi:hypothetical protein